MQDDGSRGTRVRVTRHDHTIVEGTALAINVDGLTIATPAHIGLLTVSHSEIARLEVHVPDRRREWLIAAAGIAVVTGTLVAFARLPFVGADADTTPIVMLLYVVGAAVTPFVLSRTPLGAWLHRWRGIFGDGDTKSGS